MDWIKTLGLLVLLGCQTLRPFEICLVDEPKASCNEGDKHRERAFPDEMNEWHFFNEDALALLAEKLEQCEIDGRLPSNDRTFEDMHVCQMKNLMCDNIVYRDLKGYYGVSNRDIGKIKSKLEFCRR